VPISGLEAGIADTQRETFCRRWVHAGDRTGCIAMATQRRN